MDPRVEPITWRTVSGFLVLAMLIGVVAAPIAIWFGGSGQAIIVRLAVALFSACVLYRLVVVVREAAGIGETTRMEQALEPQELAVKLDPLLLRLAGESRTGLRWNVVPAALQDRLRQLSRQMTGEPLPELMPRAGRRLTWSEVGRVIDHLERHS